MGINLGGNFGMSNNDSMPVLNLQKNDILDLTKKDPSLKNVILAAGWDVAKKGFFGLGKDFDLDLVALLLDESGKLIAKDGMVYFGNKRNNGIFLHGDNLTGHGDGDDERISVSLNNLPTRCCRIMFAVTIYEGKARKQSFSKVKNAYVRLLNEDKSCQEICRYNLTEDAGNNTCVKFAELRKENGEWQFKVVSEAIEASIQELYNSYR